MALVFRVTVEAAEKPGFFHICWLDKQENREDRFEQSAQELGQAELNRLWYDAGHQVQIGRKLFRFLDGERGFLARALDQARHEDKQLILQLVTSPAVDNWPFELLAQKNGFLLLNRLHLVRCVSDWGKDKHSQPADRPLSLLFMACSGLDVKPELDFEKEEEAIVNITDNLPVDIEVEDSGSLVGLHERLLHGRRDVVHLSGHAGIDKDGEPFFIMEDETGQGQWVNAEKLWHQALNVNPPQVLFLSGCSTGESPHEQEPGDDETGLSFARSLARLETIPAILGWGRPVGDAQAMVAETVFYRELSRGKGVLEAVRTARQELARGFLDIHYPAWPLLRFFSGEMMHQPLVTPGQKARPKPRDMKHRYLKQGRVRVLEEGFVGRRRQIQAGLRALTRDKDKFGVLLHGPGGLGKSCLAGKLCERFPSHHLVVVHGKFNAVTLEKALREAFLISRDKTGQEILAQEKDMNERLAELCVSSFKERNYLFLLDDFEQNQEGYDRGQPGSLFFEAAVPLHTLLHRLPYSGKMSQLVITGRYRFTVSEEGVELVSQRLQAIGLTSFRHTEQWKKARELKHIIRHIYTRPELVKDLIDLGRGNPRLMEWIDTLVGEMQGAEVKELIRAVRDKQEQFIQDHVLRELVCRGGEGVRVFLERFAVFRVPVFREGAEAAALSAGLSDWSGSLERTLDLGLVEFDAARGVYEVTPMVKGELVGALCVEDRQAAERAGFEYYGGLCQSLESLEPLFHEEWVYHALGCGEEDVASVEGARLVGALGDRLAFRESRRVGEWVLGEKGQALATGHDAFLLNELGYTLQDMGDNRQAIEYFSQALDIWKKVYGENHQDVATALNNLGEAYRELGEPKKAIEYYSRALDIDEKVFGKDHPKVAIRLNNLGAAWKALGETKKAIDYYSRALAIDEKVFGKEHPSVARDLNNLGAAHNELGKHREAIEYFERALDIWKKVYGENHPQVAASLNNLGAAWDDLGDKQKAIEYYNQALAIDEKVYGKDHPKVAIRLNNLGEAWRGLGEPKKAIGYYSRALAIDEKVFGKDHPAVARDLNNLGAAHFSLGDKVEARAHFRRAYDIFKKFFGDDHPHTKISKEWLDQTWGSGLNI